MACAACHGAQGSGLPNSYFPRLAGQPADYLFEQLKAFRDGRRSYAPMNALLMYLSDPYLKKMAEYYAQQDPGYPASDPPSISDDAAEHARQLVLEGDAARGLPACAACHGGSLTGIQPGVPGLLGLNAAYVSAQLGEWRAGTRHGAAPDCMRTVSAKLSDNDISALAGWIAAQPKPATAQPAPANARTLPLECGAQARQ